MDSAEQRGSERLTLSIPIRVIGIDASGSQFSEDTLTRVVNRAGARIALTHRVNSGDAIRIINLESYSEADFRVVGPTSLGGENPELGVECTEVGRNIWGIELPQPLDAQKSEAAALLECRGCQQQALWAVTLMEAEVLDSTGQIPRECDRCGKLTYWTYVETTRRPRAFDAAEPVAPPPRAEEILKKAEKRIDKRLGMKLPIRVRNQKGESEVSKTENISKGGFAVNLGMELDVGEVVFVVCPYSPGGQDIEQKAEVRRRPVYDFGGRRLYGFHYIR